MARTDQATQCQGHEEQEASIYRQVAHRSRTRFASHVHIHFGSCREGRRSRHNHSGPVPQRDRRVRRVPCDIWEGVGEALHASVGALLETRGSQERPTPPLSQVHELLRHLLLKMAWLADDAGVQPSDIFNLDETSCSLLPQSNRGFLCKGRAAKPVFAARLKTLLSDVNSAWLHQALGTSLGCEQCLAAPSNYGCHFKTKGMVFGTEHSRGQGRFPCPDGTAQKTKIDANGIENLVCLNRRKRKATKTKKYRAFVGEGSNGHRTSPILPNILEIL